MANIVEKLESKIKEAETQMQKHISSIQSLQQAVHVLNGAIQGWQDAVKEIKEFEVPACEPLVGEVI